MAYLSSNDASQAGNGFIAFTVVMHTQLDPAWWNDIHLISN